MHDFQQKNPKYSNKYFNLNVMIFLVCPCLHGVSRAVRRRREGGGGKSLGNFTSKCPEGRDGMGWALENIENR